MPTWLAIFATGYVGYFVLDARWPTFYYAPIAEGKDVWLFVQLACIALFPRARTADGHRFAESGRDHGTGGGAAPGRIAGPGAAGELHAGRRPASPALQLPGCLIPPDERGNERSSERWSRSRRHDWRTTRRRGKR
jgi:hypothetical protein